MDRITLLETYCAVAELGSFAAAAEKLNLSRSVTSKYVASLEEQLGARLLHRTTRRLSLTEVGQGFYERARQIVLDYQEATEQAGNMTAVPRGKLKINAPMTFGYLHLAKAVGAFMCAYPEIEVEMVLNDRRVDLVDEGFDVAVRIGKLNDSSLIARKIAPVQMKITASPDYLERHGVPSKPEDLEQHNCLIYTYVSEPGMIVFQEDGQEKRIRVSGSFAANNGHAIAAAASAGLGVCFSPDFIVDQYIEKGELAQVMADQVLQPVNIYAVYASNRQLTAKVRVFVDFLVQRYKDGCGWC